MNWVKCSDRLPENDDLVLVYNHKDGVHAGYFEEDEVRGYWEDDKNYFVTNSGWTTYYEWAPYTSPTHWMPLPEEPNETDDLLNEIIREGNERMANNTWMPNKTI